jgi:hypothetical protein
MPARYAEKAGRNADFALSNGRACPRATSWKQRTRPTAWSGAPLKSSGHEHRRLASDERSPALLLFIKHAETGSGTRGAPKPFAVSLVDMKSIFLWLLGVPLVVIVLLNITGMLGH